MFSIAFTALDKVTDFRGTLVHDKAKLGRFIAAMHNEGVRIIGRGLWYIGALHTEADIDHAISTANRVFPSL
jgi:glutamate-1-semialdehyde 2,1-aminomutase